MKASNRNEIAPVIAIDGPGGSGKGTISRLLAGTLGFYYLDSGALYRAVGFEAHRRRVQLTDVEALAALAGQLDISFTPAGAAEPRVDLAGEDVSLAIRTEASGAAASQIAAIPEVRAALLAKQRNYARPPGLVADGRDMGTVVFPQAALKIFLVASLEERAKRRQKQLKEQGISASLSDLLDDLARRDARDSGRTTAPLKPAPDAVVLDSTGKDVKTVVAQALGLANERIARADR